MRARHLLVIGAQRCGTTYLHGLLDAHPEITMARPSRPEPKVFCSDELTARGREWYRTTYFAHATDERLLGDKSTSYLDDDRAPERAATMLDDPIVLVQLRDPVARAVSHWRFSTTHGLETRPLTEALVDELEHGPPDWDRSKTSVSPYEYLRRGRYAEAIDRWRQRFGDDVHVSLFDDLTAHPESIGDLYERLGVDSSVRPEGLGEAVNASGPTVADHELSADLEARLREYFAYADAALATALDRDLPWATMGTDHSLGD